MCQSLQKQQVLDKRKNLTQTFVRKHLAWKVANLIHVGENDTMKKDYCQPLIIQMADMIWKLSMNG